MKNIIMMLADLKSFLHSVIISSLVVLSMSEGRCGWSACMAMAIATPNTAFFWLSMAVNHIAV